MELAKIPALLEKYFEGNTTLAEETQLKEFFTRGEVPPNLVQYKPLFEGFAIAREEKLSKQIALPKEKDTSSFWKWGIAASFVLLLGISSAFFFGNTGLSQEEQEALAAYNNAKETMLLLSENLNKGASKVTYFEEFSENASTLQVINQFNETTSKYLK